MGCDLHAVVYAGESWEPDNPVPLFSIPEPRSYALFGAMAGVRSYDIEAVVEPRGLPDFVKLDDDRVHLAWSDGTVWIGDHTYSWLTPSEFAEAIRRVEEHYGERCVGPEYKAMLAAMREFEKAGRKTALVFGFDN